MFYHRKVYDPMGMELHATVITTHGEVRGDHFDPPVMRNIFEIFDEGCRCDRGYPIRLDLLMLYDPATLHSIHGPGGCEFSFKDPSRKLDALVGLIKIPR